jgi:hypothetical protein
MLYIPYAVGQIHVSGSNPGLLSLGLVVSLTSTLRFLRLPATYNIHDSVSFVIQCYMTSVILNKSINNVRINQSIRISMIPETH